MSSAILGSCLHRLGDPGDSRAYIYNTPAGQYARDLTWKFIKGAALSLSLILSWPKRNLVSWRANGNPNLQSCRGLSLNLNRIVNRGLWPVAAVLVALPSRNELGAASSLAGIGLGPTLGLSWRRAERAGLGCRAWLGCLAGRFAHLHKAELNRQSWLVAGRRCLHSY